MTDCSINFNKFHFQVKSGFANDEDVKSIVRQMRDRVALVKRERERRHAEAAKVASALEAGGTLPKDPLSQNQLGTAQPGQLVQTAPAEPPATTQSNPQVGPTMPSQIPMMIPMPALQPQGSASALPPGVSQPQLAQLLDPQMCKSTCLYLYTMYFSSCST